MTCRAIDNPRPVPTSPASGQPYKPLEHVQKVFRFDTGSRVLNLDAHRAPGAVRPTWIVPPCGVNRTALSSRLLTTRRSSDSSPCTTVATAADVTVMVISFASARSWNRAATSSTSSRMSNSPEFEQSHRLRCVKVPGDHLPDQPCQLLRGVFDRRNRPRLPRLEGHLPRGSPPSR